MNWSRLHIFTRTQKPSNKKRLKIDESFEFCAHKKLVGGWTNLSEKYARQIGSFPHVVVNIKNLWTHHPDLFTRTPKSSNKKHLKIDESFELSANKKTSWWLNQPIWKILVKLKIYPNFRGENNKIYNICETNTEIFSLEHENPPTKNVNPQNRTNLSSFWGQ